MPGPTGHMRASPPSTGTTRTARLPPRSRPPPPPPAAQGHTPPPRPPAEEPAAPALPWVGTSWRRTTSIYGPAFPLASEPVARVAGTSATRAAWLFKALAALGMLLATLAATRVARNRV